MIDAEKTITRARRKLGEPLSKVELADEQMTSLLKEAHETFYLYADISKMGWEDKDRVEDAWIKKYFYALCKETLGRVRENANKIDMSNPDESYKSLLLEADREKAFLKYIIFKEKELISWVTPENVVLVFYIDVRGLESREAETFALKTKSKLKIPEGFTSYYIQTKEGESRVECIYPVSAKLDGKEEHIIDRLNSYLKDTTNNLLNNKEEDE